MYNFPKSTDRYIDLMYEVYEFIKSSLLNGLNTLVVIGAHEIGMDKLYFTMFLLIHAPVFPILTSTIYLNSVVCYLG